MIVRIVRGSVARDAVPAFRDLARSTVADLRMRDGVVSANVARRAGSDGGEEVVFATVWRDMPALYAWIGCSDLLDVPAPIARFETCFAGRDLQYYEIIDTDTLPAEPVEAGSRL